MNTLPKISDLPLHDAVLHSVTLHWKEAKVELYLSAFTAAGESATPHKLVIMGVEEAMCPHFAPWGDSVCINSAEEVSGTYRIEMQSGDVLTFKGKGLEFGKAAL